MAFVPRLHIHNLGPIKDCELPMNRMMVLNGPQAAGKSTIAKAIFFFRTVKDELYKTFLTGWADPVPELNARWFLLRKLNRIFGDYMSSKNEIFLSYEYAPEIKIEIVIAPELPATIKFSSKILKHLETYRELDYNNIDISKIRQELQDLFADNSEIVYIPAGRSFTSLLTHQLNYILATMNDKQKETLDYCVMEHIERVLKIKPQLSEQRLYYEVERADVEYASFMGFIRESMNRILKGSYTNKNGMDEIVMFNPNVHIPLSLASSGQQEVVWILNLIYYYLREKQPTMFIIEEPEAHLYPDSQKKIAEYIVLALHERNECVVTTHSPYILGALNNLLDINRLANKGINIANILETNGLLGAQLLNRKEFVAHFVDGGSIEDAMDEETGLIRNEMIDGASDKINRLADEIFALECANDE